MKTGFKDTLLLLSFLVSVAYLDEYTDTNFKDKYSSGGLGFMTVK